MVKKDNAVVYVPRGPDVQLPSRGEFVWVMRSARQGIQQSRKAYGGVDEPTQPQKRQVRDLRENCQDRHGIEQNKRPKCRRSIFDKRGARENF